MTTFIIVTTIVIFIVLLIISKGNNNSAKNNASAPAINLKITTDSSLNGKEHCEKYESYNKPIKQTDDGWIINPDTPFELTVLDCDYDIASQIRQLCDQSKQDGYRTRRELFSLFSENRIRIKEIEEYKKKYSAEYFKRIEVLKENSKEYIDSDTKDREILLEEFKIKAQDCIYELPQFDVYKLFIEDDMTMYNKLVQQFGCDCADSYLCYFGKIGEVVTVDKQSYHRIAFEKMTENGMATQGKDIPITDILYSQSLKTLNAIANDPQKEYKRKNQAIEYILEHDEAACRIGELIAFRELFKLNPLPSEYDGIDIGTFNRISDCYREEILLLLRTYNDSLYVLDQLKDKGFYKRCMINGGCDECKCAKDRQKKTYSINNIPKTPCHIGCTCDIYFVE